MNPFQLQLVGLIDLVQFSIHFGRCARECLLRDQLLYHFTCVLSPVGATIPVLRKREDLRDNQILEDLSYLLPVVNIDEDDVDVEERIFLRPEDVVELAHGELFHLTFGVFYTQLAIFIVYTGR